MRWDLYVIVLLIYLFNILLVWNHEVFISRGSIPTNVQPVYPKGFTLGKGLGEVGPIDLMSYSTALW